VMIHDGRKVIDDRLSDIHARHQTRALLFNPLDPAADVAAVFAPHPLVAGVSHEDGRWRPQLDEGVELDDAVQGVAARLAPSRLELQRPTLEDIFVDIVTDGAGHAAFKEEEVMA